MVLDEDATQKYVLIEAYPDGGSEDPTYLVRGSRHAKYHKDAAKETLEALEAAVVPHRVLGGGWLNHDVYLRTVDFYGASQGYPWEGAPRHDIAVERCAAALGPDFTVGIKDDEEAEAAGLARPCGDQQQHRCLHLRLQQPRHRARRERRRRHDHRQRTARGALPGRPRLGRCRRQALLVRSLSSALCCHVAGCDEPGCGCRTNMGAADQGTEGSIYSSRPDGSGVACVVPASGPIGTPKQLVLDPARRQLYCVSLCPPRHQSRTYIRAGGWCGTGG